MADLVLPSLASGHSSIRAVPGGWICPPLGPVRGHGVPVVTSFVYVSWRIDREENPCVILLSIRNLKQPVHSRWDNIKMCGDTSSSPHLPSRPFCPHGCLVETPRSPGTLGCCHRRLGRPCHPRRLPWVQGNKRQERWINLDRRPLPRRSGVQFVWDRHPAVEAPGDLRDRYDILLTMGNVTDGVYVQTLEFTSRSPTQPWRGTKFPSRSFRAHPRRRPRTMKLNSSTPPNPSPSQSSGQNQTRFSSPPRVTP